MVPVLFFLLFAAIGLTLFAWWFANANPRPLARILRSPILRWGFAVVAVAVGFVLMIRGGLGALGNLIGIALLIAPLLLNFRALANRARNRRGPTPGSRSGVETEWLQMDLDHDTGSMDGLVLQGAYRGLRLSEMGIQDLIELLAACRLADPSSAALLETYLDRTVGPDWRDSADGAGADGAGADRGEPGSDAADPAGTGMTREQARQLLGVGKWAGREEIMAAYRQKISEHHPDRGGDAETAARINEARRILLDE